VEKSRRDFFGAASQSEEGSAAIERTAAEWVWLFVTLYLYLPSAKGVFSTQPGAMPQESGHMSERALKARLNAARCQ